MGGAGASAFIRLAAILGFLAARAGALSHRGSQEPIWSLGPAPAAGRTRPWTRGDPAGGQAWWPWPGDEGPVVPPGLLQDGREGSIPGLLGPLPPVPDESPPQVPYAPAADPGASDASAPAAVAPRCSRQERRAVRMETEIMARMTGKYTSSITVHPEESPGECTSEALYVYKPIHARYELGRNQSLGCFRRWGLKGPFARCWATEAAWKDLHCGQACALAPMKDWRKGVEQDCNVCAARHLAEKYVCTGRANGVGQDCAVCRAEADVFYQDYCTALCARRVVYVGPTRTATVSGGVSDECRACGDRAHDKWMSCFPN